MGVTWFSPIERGDPDATIENAGFVSLTFPLNREPPDEWVPLFDHATGWTTAFDPPKVYMSRISARCRDETLVGSVIDNVDKRIAKANSDYEATIVPRMKASDETRNREDEERQRKLEAVRKAIADHEETRREPPTKA